MLKTFNTIQVTCDAEFHPSTEFDCWTANEPFVLSLDPGETKKDAIEFLEKIGWHIESKTETVNDMPLLKTEYICPYCWSGITKEEAEEKMNP
jgi:hypothetical protein